MCQRKDLYYQGSIMVGRRPDGRPDRRYIVGDTRREVQDALARILADAQQGTLPSPQRLTVSQYLQRWLEHVRPPVVELRTWKGYESLVRLHVAPQLGALALKQLRPLHLQELYTARLRAGRHPKTVLNIHRCLRTALQQAVRWGLLALNPADATQPPAAESGEQGFLTVDQARTLLQALESERLGPLILTGLLCGLRAGEVTALRWRDLDTDHGDVVVHQTVWWTKGGYVFKARPLHRPRARRVRRVTLPASLLPILRAHRDRQLFEQRAYADTWQDLDLVFPDEIGRPVRPDRLLRQLRRILAAAGLPPIRFHDLRHSAATIMLAAGVPVRDVSAQLGHSSAKLTLDLYGHVLPGAQPGAAKAMDTALFGEDGASEQRQAHRGRKSPRD